MWQFALYFVLIVPGLVAAYFMFVRPVLHAIPALKQFYSEADTFWMKVSALGWHSATIAWSYVMMAASVVVGWFDPLAGALGDPDFKGQVLTLLQNHPKLLYYFPIVVSMVTIVARLRSIKAG